MKQIIRTINDCDIEITFQKSGKKALLLGCSAVSMTWARENHLFCAPTDDKKKGSIAYSDNQTQPNTCDITVHYCSVAVYKRLKEVYEATGADRERIDVAIKVKNSMDSQSFDDSIIVNMPRQGEIAEGAANVSFPLKIESNKYSENIVADKDDEYKDL